MKRIFHYAMLCVSILCPAASCSGNEPGETADPDKLKSLTISSASLELTVGQTSVLTVEGVPSTASLDNLRWSSRDTGIAGCEDGTVTAVAVGTVTVTARCDGVTATCEIVVKAAPATLNSITLSPSAAIIPKGGTQDLEATILPEGSASAGDIVWASSDISAATVDRNGRITAVADGHATITATIGSVAGRCDVEVYTKTTSRTFTFFQLNLWEGLVNVGGGVRSLIDHLVALRPDAASFCEFPSTGSAESILSAAATALYEQTGIPYYYTYRGGSGTRGLLTRHRVLSSGAVNNSSWFYRTVVDFYGQEIALYASHAHYSYYACYLPRGYGDGESPYGWNKIADGPVTDVAYILEREELSNRSRIATDFVADVKTQHDAGRLCIFGGDLNQPSHLDWTEAAGDKFEHNGCVVAWPISTKCYENGIHDAFREIYPDPVTHPGVTWPVHNKDAGKATPWTADADERDRIDYVYYRTGPNIEVRKAQMVGPSAMVSKGKTAEDTFVNRAEELIEPVDNRWPSDHRGVFVTFDVKFP